MEAKYYLVTTTTYTFDGHGEALEGEVKKEIEHTDYWNDKDLSLTYNDEGEPYVAEEDDESHEQDGYHCIREEYKAREITAAQAIEFQQIINAYNAL